MKKSTKIILGSLFVLGLIGGCTEEETEQQEEQVKTEQQEQEQEKEEQEKKEEVKVEEEKPKTMQDIFIEQGVPTDKIDSLMATLKEIAGNDAFIIEFVGEPKLHDGGCGMFTINIMQGDSWSDKGISVNLTIFEGEIRLANSGDLQLYNKEEGGLKISYAETILTTEEAVEFRMIAEDVMTAMAQNPSTVDFVSLFTTKNKEWRRGEVVTVQGVMSCLNGLGMELKYLYQVQLNYYTGELIDVAYEQTR